MKKLLALVAASLFAVSGVQAAVVSFGASYGPAPTDWDPVQSLSLQRFDAAQGSLNSVSFGFTGSMRSDFDGTSSSASSQQFSPTLTGTMHFGVPTTTGYGISLSATRNVVLAGNASYLDSISDSQSISDTLWTNLSAFIGTDSFDVDVLALGFGRFSGAGNVNGGAETFATAHVLVTYDYTASRQNVPEPASLALVGLALVGLALTGLAPSRRRRA